MMTMTTQMAQEAEEHEIWEEDTLLFQLLMVQEEIHQEEVAMTTTGTKIPAKTDHGGTMDQAKVCGTTTEVEQQWEQQRAVQPEVKLQEKKKKVSARKKELKKRNMKEMRKKKLSQKGM